MFLLAVMMGFSGRYIEQKIRSDFFRNQLLGAQTHLWISYDGYLVAHPTARKWVITPVRSGLTLLIPFITGVVTHLLSGMNHQV